MVARQEYYLGMRRRFTQILAAAAVLVSGAIAQGVPASVTSPGFGGNKFNGVPASVTSPGFGSNGSHRFFTSPPPTHIFPPGTHFPVNQHRRHDHIVPNGFGAVYAVPYYVPVDTTEPVDDTMEQVPADQYLGGPTLFDRRGSGVAAPASVERAPQQEAEVERPAIVPDADPAPTADQPQTVLVFKDGHHIEVQNYAIVGNQLYDMTAGRAHKILLADLDIPATTKQNDDRGIDFHLPPSPKEK